MALAMRIYNWRKFANLREVAAFLNHWGVYKQACRPWNTGEKWHFQQIDSWTRSAEEWLTSHGQPAPDWAKTCTPEELEDLIMDERGNFLSLDGEEDFLEKSLSEGPEIVDEEEELADIRDGHDDMWF
jgi:hypothetical protein